MPRVLLSLHGLAAGYSVPRGAARVVVGPLDLSIRAGEFVCLLGPNGAGKSTLMRTIAGMQASIRGEARLDGENVRRLSSRALARRVSVVLTERVTGGLLTVYDLVALGRHPFTAWSGRLTSKDHEVIDSAIRAVHAESLANRLLGELSDGERQKAMVARALAQEPELMILDELTAFLDLPRRVEIMTILRRLAHEEQRAILLSTHDLDLALHTADTLWLVRGTSVLAGLPEELVLAGAFEAAFATDGVAFDRALGSFRIRQHGRETVVVEGDSLTSTWTRRALERFGYDVVAGGTAAFSIRVDGTEEDPVWTLARNGQEHIHRSLRGMLEGL